MKPLYLLVTLLSLCAVTSHAQLPGKPKVFASYPERFICSGEKFNEAFAIAEGYYVNLELTPGFIFRGRVTSNIQRYSNLYSMTIQSIEFENAVFHLSKQIGQDNSITYVGRIMSMNADDGYVLQRSEGQYIMEKTEEKFIRQVCNY